MNTGPSKEFMQKFTKNAPPMNKGKFGNTNKKSKLMEALRKSKK